MLYPINNREDLQKLDEAVSLQNQLRAVRLQDRLGEQNYHEDTKKLFKPLTDVIKNTSENKTKTLTENSINNNKAIENLNEKILEVMNDRGMIAPYLASSLVNLFKPENKSQFRLRKDPNSTKMNDVLIHSGIPVTVYSNKITFRDSNKSFELEGDLLKLITIYKFNADHSNPQDRKIIGEFAREMNYDTKSTGRPSVRHNSIIKILNSPAILASGIKTNFLSSDPDDLFDRLKLLLQETQAGNNSIIINDEIVALVDKLLEYKCITKKQHKQILIKCNLIPKQT